MFVEMISMLKLTVLEFLASFSLIVFLIFPLQSVRKDHWEAIFVQANKFILNESKHKMWASLFMIVFMTPQSLTHNPPPKLHLQNQTNKYSYLNIASF